MSAFEIYINSRRLCTAALQSDGVLTTMLTFFRGAGPAGKRLEEAKLINLSLTTLAKVINALTETRPTHAPFRDSVVRDHIHIYDTWP